jgi:hypothetical protein
MFSAEEPPLLHEASATAAPAPPTPANTVLRDNVFEIKFLISLGIELSAANLFNLFLFVLFELELLLVIAPLSDRG